MPRLTIADAALAALTQERALSAEELGRRLAAQGVTKAQRPAAAVDRALESDARFRQLQDGRWVCPSMLLEGASLLHRLAPEGSRRGVLPLEPDLAPLAWLDHENLVLSDWQPLGCRHGTDARALATDDCDTVLTGPTGWLARVGPLVCVRVDHGRLSVATGQPPTADSRIALRRLVEGIRERLGGSAPTWMPDPVNLGAVVLELLVDSPDLLAEPVAPLGEALAAAGMDVHRDWVGTPGTDWREWDAWLDADDSADDDEDDPDEVGDPDDEEIAAALGLDRGELDGLSIVLGAKDLHERLGGFDRPDALPGIATIIAIPAIARILGIRAWTDPTLEPFIADIAEGVRGREAAGVRYVLAACAEARADILGSERLLRGAVSADPGFEPALVELARVEEDRGNRAAALQLLRVAGAPVSGRQRAFLEALAAPAERKVGRNEPCPCGSGKKYKACHLGREQLAPLDAAESLLRKLWVWVDRPEVDLLADKIVADARLAPPDPDGDGRLPDGAETLIRDILLFDRGGLERFLDTRGVLLPANEVALGRTWVGSRRALCEVQAVDRGRGVTLRDMDTGVVTELPDRTVSRTAQPLDVACLRLLPDGEGGVLTIDGVMVPRFHRGRVAEMIRAGDGLALLRWLVDPMPTIQMRTTEGEQIRFVTATYRLPDAAGASRALGRKLRDEGEGRFSEMVERRGTDWLRGSITMAGDLATIETNAVERADRLVKTLLRAAPGAVLVRREERSFEDVRVEAAASGRPPSEPLDPAQHPELAEALEEFMQAQERRWVDESIPMLGGMTPRQALADPARRADLEAFLDDMAWDQRDGRRSGGMDDGRIRKLLGLPPGRLG